MNFAAIFKNAKILKILPVEQKLQKNVKILELKSHIPEMNFIEKIEQLLNHILSNRSVNGFYTKFYSFLGLLHEHFPLLPPLGDI